MRKMKDSGIEWIGEIPEEWKKIKFKYLHYGMNTGEAIDKEYWSSNEYDRVFYTAGLLPIRTTYLEFPEWKLTRDNDLLLSRNGTPYVYFPSEYACYTDHIIRAKIKKDVCKKFLQYALQRSISTIVVNQVSIATWSASLWNEQILPFPPLSEQQRIANFLDEKVSQIDSTISKTRESIEEYKKLKQSIITEAVTKGLNPNAKMKNSGIEWIGEIPEDWEVNTIKYCSWLKGRIGWDGLKSTEYTDEGPFLITGTNFDKGIINWDSCVHITKERFEEDLALHIVEDDLLITKDGTVGKVAIAKNCPQDVSLNSGVLLIRNIREYKYHPKYMYYILNSNQFLLWFQLSQSGQSTIKHLYQEQFYHFRFSYPPISEQQQISDFLDKKCSEIDKLITKKEQLVVELEAYKKSLIYEVVTGKREV